VNGAEVLERPRRDLGADELWRRSLARSRERRALAEAGMTAPRSLISLAIPDLDAPSEYQLVARAAERDLSDGELWDLSLACARAKRLAAEKGLLPQARVASASLVVAAVAAVAPTQGGAHPRASSAGSAQIDQRLLKRGSRGSAVKAVQRALGILADGVYGPQTRAAVRAFQTKNGLVADGIVGAKTRAALFPPGAGASGKLIRASWVAPVQRALGVAVDGLYGPQTRAAVRAFQAKNGLVADGIVGAKTRAALFPRSAGGSRKLIRASWVAPVQRALGVAVDGVYGPQTRAAVRAFQARHGLVVDGIVGRQTLAALGLAGGGASRRAGHQHHGGEAGARERARRGSAPRDKAGAESGPESVTRSLWDELALARSMGLRLISGYRAGATIGGGGSPSDHSHYPSRAIDVAGSPAAMREYALAVAGRAGIEYVIYSPLGMWGSWNGGWRAVSGETRAAHYSHVHVSAST
jgi:peptidoglycan hydrolase-like protein with peptidoglycan-binding domain